MKLIVGLGNPGRKYERTRHNVGFDVIAELASQYDVGRPKAKFDGEFAETIIQNEKVALLCPLTFMNLSGQTVRAAVDFYKLSLEDILIVCDDMNLSLGRLRFRPSGSAGGNNGLKDIIARLGSNQFSRLRLGVGRPQGEMDSANYVLGRFSNEDRIVIDKSVKNAADAALLWVAQGVQAAMNKFNPDPDKPKQPKNKKPDLDSKSESKQDPTNNDPNVEESKKENQSG